jgi:predicted dienelactone hydrolase
MKKRYGALGAIGLMMLGATGALAVANRLPGPVGPVSETPELGKHGDFAIGTVEKDYVYKDRARISAMGALTGNLATGDRQLKVRLWYPAGPTTDQAASQYSHTFNGPGQPAFDIVMQGVARENAPAIRGKQFPLVVMSHGFGGWNTQFSNLGEAIASHGYVVASIDHGEPPITSKTGFLLSFQQVLLDRTQDQRQVLTSLLEDAASLNIDGEKVGLLGYSMGGYGALSTAGAGYDRASKTIGQLPANAQQIVTTPAQDIATKIDALILVSPWGGQPDSRVWTPESLTNIKSPTLLISGNQDDIINFKEGVTWIFNHLKSADRHLLVFRDARHNIIGNHVPSTTATAFPVIEFMNEPVWRQDRLNMINQHFVTAFLDLHLKGDASKAAYLNVPTESSADGDWPVAFGESVGGTLAGNAQPKYWRGFQRRWALGLEMMQAKKDATKTDQAN